MIFVEEASNAAKKAFKEYDKNNDGRLSKTELRPLLDRVANLLNLPKASDKNIEEGIKQLDNNKNGFLEFNEFFKFFLQVYQELENN